MKSHSWDDLNDSAKDFFDSAAFIPESEIDEEPVDKHMQRRRLTELRRRTEERLDWKRLYGELQFDEDAEPVVRTRFSFDDYNDFDESFDDH